MPLSPDGLTQRIQSAAIEYKAYAPISRVGFNDIAYPANKIEAKLLRGYALLLITAFSQEPDELPLKRVFVVLDGKSADLKLLGAVSSETPEADAQVRATFGRYRSDSLYLVPISAAVQHGVLYADFAKNKEGFKLSDTEGPPDGPLKNWRNPPKPGVQPDNKALTEMIRREYPGFLAE